MIYKKLKAYFFEKHVLSGLFLALFLSELTKVSFLHKEAVGRIEIKREIFMD